MRAVFFLVGLKAQSEEGVRRILLGDSRGCVGDVVFMLLLIQYQFAGISVSTVLSFFVRMYLVMNTRISDLSEIRLAPKVSEGKCSVNLLSACKGSKHQDLED